MILNLIIIFKIVWIFNQRLNYKYIFRYEKGEQYYNGLVLPKIDADQP